MRPRRIVLPALVLLALAAPAPAADYDVVVYGGTVRRRRRRGPGRPHGQDGRPDRAVGKHIGGLTSGGLGWTDTGNKAVIGGIAREFYQRVKKHYDDPEAWKSREARSAYKFYRPDDDAMWTFEPHVAEKILREMLDEHKVAVVFGERLDRDEGREARRQADRRPSPPSPARRSRARCSSTRPTRAT